MEVDELFRTFNPEQRRNFQIWMEQLALATAGRGRDISETIGNLAPFAEEAQDLVRVLNAQAPAVRGRRLKLLYMTQFETRPPRFVVKLSDRARVTRDYAYFLENRLRDRYELAGVPLVIDFQGRQKRSEDGR